VSVLNVSGTQYARPTIAPSSTGITRDSIAALIPLRQPEPKADIEPLSYTASRAWGVRVPVADRSLNFDRDEMAAYPNQPPKRCYFG
jgi:hypothetical protein